jgi:hypothetical protein
MHAHTRPAQHLAQPSQGKKIKKNEEEEDDEEILCTLGTTSAGRTFNTNGSRPSLIFAFIIFFEKNLFEFNFFTPVHFQPSQKTSDEMKV